MKLTRRTKCKNLKAIHEGLRCLVTYADYPPGTTCFDIVRDAKENAEEYTEEMRGRILSGENLCDRCAVVVALRSLPSASVAGALADIIHGKNHAGKRKEEACLTVQH